MLIKCFKGRAVVAWRLVLQSEAVGLNPGCCLLKKGIQIILCKFPARQKRAVKGKTRCSNKKCKVYLIYLAMIQQLMVLSL